MTTVLMRGPKTLRDGIVAYLSVEVPKQIVVARSQWGLNAQTLPTPTKYDHYEPYALDEYPAMGVTVTTARDFRLNDMDAYAQREYRARYSVRLFTWVRSPLDTDDVPFEPSYDETVRLRDDMAVVVRSVLLATSSLGSIYLMWDESSLSEEYSEATAVKGNRFIAGVAHSFDVQVDESLYLPPIGIDNETLIEAMTINEQIALVAEEQP